MSSSLSDGSMNDRCGNSWPFLRGPRICSAQQPVLTQVVYALVRLVREFASIRNRDPTLEYVERTKMTVESRNGVKIALCPASSDERRMESEQGPRITSQHN